MPYTIEEHKHISSAWGAATGARASKLCRFPVAVGRKILEEAGFTAQFTVKDLPRPTDLDEQHAKWRRTVIKKAKNNRLRFTHGIAAKLINSYLKDRFVCGGEHEHKCVRCLHPPIDEVLLKELAAQNIGGFKKQWQEFRQKRWSKYNSKTYQSVIDHIRKSLRTGEPLWKIEKYWKGHQ